MNSYYKCEFAGRSVTVWPCITDERHFYDVVIAEVDDPATARTVTRLTADEAASYVLTELGTPVRTTVDSLAGMIRRWRDELGSQVREPVR